MNCFVFILPYLITAILIGLALFILIRHIRKLFRGERSCGSCDSDCPSCRKR